MKRIGLTLILLLSTGTIHAQAPNPPPAASFKQLLSGAAFPTTLKMKDLNANEWRRFSLAAPTDGSLSNMLWFAALAGNGGGGAGADPDISNDIVYYTKGDITAFGGETFLVAYRAQLKQPDLMPLMMHQQNQKPEDLLPEKMTGETNVALSLLNVKAMKNIAEIKPFDLKQEIAENEASGKAMQALLQAANPAVEDAAVEKPPVVAPKVRAAIAADKQLKADGNSIAVVEGENTIILQGQVISNAVKKHAEDVVKKLLKEQGIGFTVQNQLSVSEEALTPKAAPAPPKKPAAKPAKKP